MQKANVTGSGRVAPSGELLSATVVRADGGWFAHSPARVNIKPSMGQYANLLDSAVDSTMDESSGDPDERLTEEEASSALRDAVEMENGDVITMEEGEPITVEGRCR